MGAHFTWVFTVCSAICCAANILWFAVSRYHLKDVIVGKIYFLLVRIKIKYMELAIVKRETTGTGDHRARFHLISIFPPKLHFILVEFFHL